MIGGILSGAREMLAGNATVRDEVLADLQAWIDARPYDDATARVLTMRAGIYREAGADARALFDMIKVGVLFPGTKYAKQARQQIDTMIRSKKYERQRSDIIRTMRSIGKGKRSYRHARLLNSLSRIALSGMREVLIHDCRLFLAHARAHELAPLVQLTLADNLAADHLGKALFQYRMLVDVYPRSRYVAHALLALGDIYQSRRNKPEEALTLYRRVIRSYPKRTAARKAYLQMAAVYERRLCNQAKATETLRVLVSKYPGTVEATNGNATLGRLYEKSRQYDLAVRTCRNMAKVSRDSRAIIAALEKAAVIAGHELHDVTLVLTIDRQICRLYPKTNACTEAHFRSARVYEKQLREPAKAIAEYQLILDRFPQHPLAKKAESRVRSLKKGGAGFSLF